MQSHLTGGVTGAVSNNSDAAWQSLLLVTMLVILGGADWYTLTQGLWFELCKERAFNTVCEYLSYTSSRGDFRFAILQPACHHWSKAQAKHTDSVSTTASCS